MKKTRRMIGLLTVLVLLFSMLVGCGSSESPGVAGTSSKTEATWRVIKEGFEADSIRFSEGTIKYTVAVFEKDGKFGLVNNQGEIVLPAEYDEITLSETEPCGDTLLRAIKSNPEEHDYMEYNVSSDGKLTKTESGGWGYHTSLNVYWYNDGVTIWDRFEGHCGSTFEEYKEYFHPRYSLVGTIVSTPHYITPIRKMTGVAYSEEEGLDVPLLESEKYALYDMKKNVFLTDYIYDDVSYIGMVNDVLPVKKGDKWGYVNAEGKEITAFEYDPSEVATDGRWRAIRFYACVNGHFVVRKGDKFGLMDKTGKLVLDPIFEDVSQVDGSGRFWVKRDGKWTLAELL